MVTDENTYLSLTINQTSNNFYHCDYFRVVFQEPRSWLIVRLGHVSGDAVVTVSLLAKGAEQPRVKVHSRTLALWWMTVVPKPEAFRAEDATRIVFSEC